MNPKVDDYIKSLNQEWWREKVIEIREALHAADPDIIEEIKWGTPAFDDHGPVAWLFCASEWVHFSFPQGALLDASHGLWVEDENTTNKAKRTMKFHEQDDIPRELIAKLAKEAVANNRSGKKIKFKPAPKQKIILPDDISTELKSQNLEENYWQRPYYQQKGYIQWINLAKQEKTRQKRIKTMMEELDSGTYMPPKGNN